MLTNASRVVSCVSSALTCARSLALAVPDVFPVIVLLTIAVCHAASVRRVHVREYHARKGRK